MAEMGKREKAHSEMGEMVKMSAEMIAAGKLGWPEEAWKQLRAENQALRIELLRTTDMLKKADCQLTEWEGQLSEAKAENEQLRQQLVSLDYKLHALTPMGSEFANNADRCIQWIEQQLSSRLAACVRATAARNELEAERDQAIAEAAELKAALQGANWIISKLGPHEALAIAERGYRAPQEDIKKGDTFRGMIARALAFTTLAEEHLAADRERDHFIDLFRRLYEGHWFDGSALAGSREGKELVEAWDALDGARARRALREEE